MMSAFHNPVSPIKIIRFKMKQKNINIKNIQWDPQ